MTDWNKLSNVKKIIITPVGKKVSTTPILVKKNSIKIFEGSNTDLLKRLSLEPSSRSLFREEVLYTSKAGDFLGNTHSITIVNRVNIFTKSNRTVAKYSTNSDDLFFEKTSDSVTKVIGQQNYDTLFLSLKSIENVELKIKGILSLLTLAKKFEETASQTEVFKSELKRFVSVENKIVQTVQSNIDYMFKPQHRKLNKRKHIKTYVVQDPKKPALEKRFPNKNIQKEVSNSEKNEQKELKDLKNDINDLLHDDRSNDSDGSIVSISGLSVVSSASKVNNLLNTISYRTDNQQESILPDSLSPQKMTLGMDPLDTRAVTGNNQASLTPPTVNSTMIRMMDGTHIVVPVKPEDHFHIATPEILYNVTKEEKVKLLKYQAYIDWVFCGVRDEDGFLPIHTAVRNNDVTLLKRQCYVLTKKGISIDEPACNMTALQMSLFNESPACLSVLLGYGADPFCGDEEDRCIVHLAAEMPGPHLGLILRHCKQNAKQIVEENEDLCDPKLTSKTDEQLAQHLLDHVCKNMDGQGYTPLMLASKAGLPANVRLLLEASPSSVHKTKASCGNTALFLAVGEASLDAYRRGNAQKVSENYRETLELLLQYGADPTTENYSGCTVNDLLQEFNVNEINQIISESYKARTENVVSDTFDPLIIIKEEIIDDFANTSVTETKIKKECDKPVILENIPVVINVNNSKGKCLKAVNPKDKIKKVIPKRSAKFDSKQNRFDSRRVDSDLTDKNGKGTLVNVKEDTFTSDIKIVATKSLVKQSSIGNMIIQNNYYVNETACVGNTSNAKDGKGQIGVSTPVVYSDTTKKIVRNSVSPSNIKELGSRVIIIDSTNNDTNKRVNGNFINFRLNPENNVLGEFLIPKNENPNNIQSTSNEIQNQQSDFCIQADEINNLPIVVVEETAINDLDATNSILNENNTKNELLNVTKEVLKGNELKNAVQTIEPKIESNVSILRLKRKNKSLGSNKSAKSLKKGDNT